MEIKQLRVKTIEVFRTVNKLKPSYMKDTYSPKQYIYLNIIYRLMLFIDLYFNILLFPRQHKILSGHCRMFLLFYLVFV